MGTTGTAGSNRPGILLYDPNPTTVKVAMATLRVAGYEILKADNRDHAVELCTKLGPGSDGGGSIVALLLDASADPSVCAQVLRGLIQVPGASELPGILMVHRNDPHPIPGAEGLPTLERPFTSQDLLQIVKDSLEHHEQPVTPQPLVAPPTPPPSREDVLKRLLSEQFPQLNVSPDQAAIFLERLDESADLPTVLDNDTLRVDIRSCRIESLLEMFDREAHTGVLTVFQGDISAILYLDDGCIRLAEYRGDDEDLKIGRFIVEGGYMRDQELEAFIIGKDPSGRPIGDRLVDAGLLSRDELNKALMAQAREITCQILTWTTGTLAFRATTSEDTLKITNTRSEETGLPIRDALLDGIRRRDEKAIMGPEMAAVDDIYLRIDERVAKIGREALTRDELAVLELLNGRNNVKELARKTRMGTFAIARILYRLSRSQLVRRRLAPSIV